MNTSAKPPFYARTALVFISVFAFVFTLWIGRDIIVPVVYALLIAVLLNPFVNFLLRKKVNKVIAITLTVSLAVLAVVAAVYLISSQLSIFNEAYPRLKEKLDVITNSTVQWVSEKFNIRLSKINAWIAETQKGVIRDFAIAETLSDAGQVMVTVMLLPVYVFLFLYYKTLLLEFIRRLFRSAHHMVVADVLINTKRIAQSYLLGLFFEMLIMAVLNSAGLLLLGIEYAILLGIIGAVLNVIPYLGGIIGVLLYMTIALITKSPVYVIYVAALYATIQFIDNNFIVPRIVAARVKLNALISIIVVLIGSALWGVSGMFLSIPLTAIMKGIFDHIEPLKPWGFLMGNIVPTNSRFSFAKKKENHKAGNASAPPLLSSNYLLK
ncbi:MAG TPA: AI-2E family transporter [Ferruginibacter sp.]|nr:AI-2E family transporter [Ferruginibacter sp.]